MSNSRGDERRRRSDMLGFQAVRVVFRSRPWPGTARAATPRIRQSRTSGAGPRRGLCVARCDLSPTGTSRGPTPTSEGQREGGSPTAAEHSGVTKSAPRLAHGPVRCLCVSARVHQIPRLRVCVYVCVCVCVCVGELTKSLVCVCACAYILYAQISNPRAGGGNR